MTDSTHRLTATELALRVGIEAHRVDALADLGVIIRDANGRFDVGDVHRVRLITAFEDVGVPLDALVEATTAGRISLAYYDQLHPEPGPLSGQTYAEFAKSLGPHATHLRRLFAAFGLAEPAPETRLTAEDEALVRDLLRIVVATRQPDLALRAVRMFGDGARRAADAALGTYGEAVRREGEDVWGLPPDEAFERVLRPWAAFAQESGRLAAWLTRRQLTRAIDEYSLTDTEQVLQKAGYVERRSEAPPAVAFVDLTGFTRLSEERGDDVAAAIAMRFGDLAADVARTRRGNVVKLLGDGVLVRFETPIDALDVTLDLLSALPAAGLPTAHAGVASGSLISRDGDVFGHTVNLAARLADAAPDGRVYVPEALARHLPSDGLVFEPVGEVHLPGIGTVTPVTVSRRG